MAEEYGQQFSPEWVGKLRDIEEKQRLLKERVLLVSQNFVSDRDEMFNTLQEMKKMLIQVREEQIKMKEFMQRLSEHIDECARKEEVLILQRQFDMIKSFTRQK